MKILVVEDQLGLVMTRMLNSMFPEAEVQLALNGRDGWYDYKEFKPDLVISDWNMPQCNGGKMCEVIKHHFPDQKIILWSAGSMPEFEGYTQHFNAILRKDCGMEQLQETIMGVMGNESLETGK